MKQGTKLRLQASADSMLHNAGAALGSVAYYVLSPIAAPVMTALHVKHVKNKAIQENKDFSTKKQKKEENFLPFFILFRFFVF